MKSFGTKMTRQMDGPKESHMVGTKITLPKDGWHKNNSSKGWAGGELYGRRENNSSKDG